MNKLKIAFFGAPDFAAHVLEKILTDLSDIITVQFVCTQPDRPSGRKQILTPTPIKLLAQKFTIPVFDTLQATDYRLLTTDLSLLFAYGEFIPSHTLKVPRWGFWNIHPSLLPLYRGPSPIVYPLLLGDKKTGVSLIQMNEHMDSGPIISQEKYIILPIDTQESLKNKLSDIGYKLFKNSIQMLLNGMLHKKEQIGSQATYTRLLTKNDGYIPFPIFQKIVKKEPLSKDDIPPIISEYCTKYHLHPTPYTLHTTHYHSLFRALSPWPGLWTLLPGKKRLKIIDLSLSTNHYPLITKVQLEGKKEVDFKTFLLTHVFSPSTSP